MQIVASFVLPIIVINTSSGNTYQLSIKFCHSAHLQQAVSLSQASETDFHLVGLTFDQDSNDQYVVKINPLSGEFLEQQGFSNSLSVADAVSDPYRQKFYIITTQTVDYGNPTITTFNTSSWNIDQQVTADDPTLVEFFVDWDSGSLYCLDMPLDTTLTPRLCQVDVNTGAVTTIIQLSELGSIVGGTGVFNQQSKVFTIWGKTPKGASYFFSMDLTSKVVSKVSTHGADCPALAYVPEMNEIVCWNSNFTSGTLDTLDLKTGDLHPFCDTPAGFPGLYGTTGTGTSVICSYVMTDDEDNYLACVDAKSQKVFSYVKIDHGFLGFGWVPAVAGV